MPSICSVICIDEPGDTANESEWAVFRQSLEAAKQSVSRVIVAREGYPIGDKEFSDDYGAMVMSPFEAACVSLASKPSSEGRKSAMDDLIHRVTRSSPLLPVVHDSVDCEDAPCPQH